MVQVTNYELLNEISMGKLIPDYFVKKKRREKEREGKGETPLPCGGGWKEKSGVGLIIFYF